jgi:hypothetical protein
MSRAGEGGCNCLIRHARTPEERARVARDLDYARAVGCNVGMMVSLASLGACPVDAKPAK